MPRISVCKKICENVAGSLKFIPKCLFIFAVLVAVPRSLWASNPSGSYQQTCTNISVSGTTLNATCKNASGQWAPPASLPNFNQCIGDIRNLNGQLHCNMGSSPPSGSYTQTCESIYTSGTTLNATCKNANGQWAPPSSLSNFNQCGGDIQNVNGQLECNMGSAPPSGPYTQTCEGISTSGTTLNATCKNASGQWAPPTSLPNFNQCIGVIQNYNGQLHCSMGSSPPSGSYTQTCEYIYTSGTTLNATCKNANGQWAPPSSLSNFNQCGGDIQNFNGQLRCYVAAPSPTVWIELTPTGGYPIKGIVRGQGFSNPQCHVTVFGAGAIPDFNTSGNIVTGIAVTTPCANKGQIITFKVTSNSGETPPIGSAQCPY